LASVDSYICRNETALYLVDQHAAHGAIMYRSAARNVMVVERSNSTTAVPLASGAFFLNK